MASNQESAQPPADQQPSISDNQAAPDRHNSSAASPPPSINNDVHSNNHEPRRAAPHVLNVPHTPPPNVPERQSLSPRLRRAWHGFRHVCHLIWLDVLAILVILGITGAVIKWAPLVRQKDRTFPIFPEGHSGMWKGPHWLSNPSYTEPKQNIVIDKLPNIPRFMVPILPLSVALPIVLGLVLLLMQIWVRSGWDKLAGLLALYKTLAFISLIHVCLKKFIGEFRPNFMGVCNPNWERIVNVTGIIVQNQRWGLVSDCNSWEGTRPSPELTQAMESFPSGHTSECFAAATFISLYLNGKLKPFSDYHTNFWKMLIVVAPLFAACFVAGSLTIDHNHHAHDILLSIPIGVVVAMLAYRSHYRSLFDYRTNHLYVPWSSSHRSLNVKPQASIDDLSSQYKTSRFRYYDNLAAVAWPRKPITHEFRVKDQDVELTNLRSVHSRSNDVPKHNGGYDGATDEEEVHDPSLPTTDAVTAATAGAATPPSPPFPQLIPPLQPRALVPSRSRPVSTRGILKPSSSEEEQPQTLEDDGYSAVRSVPRRIRSGGLPPSIPAAATPRSSPQKGPVVIPVPVAKVEAEVEAEADAQSRRHRPGERISVSQMV